MFHLLVIHLNAAFPNDEKRHAAALRSWGPLHKPVGTKRTTCRKAVIASLPTLLKCKFPKMAKQLRSRDFSPDSRWRLLYHFAPPLGNKANGIFTARPPSDTPSYLIVRKKRRRVTKMAMEMRGCGVGVHPARNNKRTTTSATYFRQQILCYRFSARFPGFPWHV